MSLRRAPVVALLIAVGFVGLSGCFDPIVGGECKSGYSPCHGVCVATGFCAAMDGGAPTDGGEGEASIASDADEIDGELPSDDGGAVLDGDMDVSAPDDGGGPLDVGRRDANVEVGTPDVAVPRPDGADAATDAAADVVAVAGDDALDAPIRDDLAGAGDVPPILIEGDADIDGTPDTDDNEAGCLDCLDADSLDGESLDAADDGDDGAVDAVDIDGAITDADSIDVDPDAVTPLVCNAPQTICNDECVDTSLDPENCGVCNTICSTGVCNDGKCLTCKADESVCGRVCVALATNPDNCGGCGVSCSNGICSNGHCEAAGTGRAIVIGHDYLRNRPAMNRILGNAVFLWPVNPVRLLVYEGAANRTAIVGANGAIAQVATATGRQWTPTVASDADVPTLLASHQVFLVYGQESASDATLASLALSWKDALTTFLQNGGTVIVLDAVYGNAGTSQILSLAGLVDIARATSSTGDVCTVTARGDAVATGLPRTYLCEQNSASFTLTDTSTTITRVVADGTNPVVVNKLF
jgi:hypothetical protein